MYIYNTSFMVEAPVHDRWLALVRDKYIPFLIKELQHHYFSNM